MRPSLPAFTQPEPKNLAKRPCTLKPPHLGIPLDPSNMFSSLLLRRRSCVFKRNQQESIVQKMNFKRSKCANINGSLIQFESFYAGKLLFWGGKFFSKMWTLKTVEPSWTPLLDARSSEMFDICLTTRKNAGRPPRTSAAIRSPARDRSPPLHNFRHLIPACRKAGFLCLKPRRYLLFLLVRVFKFELTILKY